MDVPLGSVTALIFCRSGCPLRSSVLWLVALLHPESSVVVFVEVVLVVVDVAVRLVK